MPKHCTLYTVTTFLMAFIRRRLPLVKVSASWLEGLKYTTKNSSKGSTCANILSHFCQDFLASIKLLILGPHSPTAILESFKTRVSVLDLVKWCWCCWRAITVQLREEITVRDVHMATFEEWLEAFWNTCCRISLPACLSPPCSF